MITLKESDLGWFTGTENHWKNVNGLIYTDGIKYMLEKGEAYWLLDAVASYQKTPKILNNYRLQDFQLWALKKVGKGCVLTCREDSDMDPVVEQHIEYTDFPFDIEFYVEGGVMLLKSEH